MEPEQEVRSGSETINPTPLQSDTFNDEVEEKPTLEIGLVISPQLRIKVKKDACPPRISNSVFGARIHTTFAA